MFIFIILLSSVPRLIEYFDKEILIKFINWTLLPLLVIIKEKSLIQERLIIIPQIFPIILPPAANLTVELLKATALVALVTVVDLTFEAKQINSITWLSAQCFVTALLIYYIIARFALVPFLRWLEVLAARKVGKERI